jgi:hypothetical protein
VSAGIVVASTSRDPRKLPFLSPPREAIAEPVGLDPIEHEPAPLARRGVRQPGAEVEITTEEHAVLVLRITEQRADLGQGTMHRSVAWLIHQPVERDAGDRLVARPDGRRDPGSRP